MCAWALLASNVYHDMIWYLTIGLTIPLVLYGIFRYLYLVHQKKGGGSPAAMLSTDRPLLICVGLWVATIVVLMYSPPGR